MLHVPLLLIIGSLAVVTLLAARRNQLGRTEGVILLAAFPAFVAYVLVA